MSMDAELLAAELLQVPPHEANSELVARCERAISALAGQEGSRLWLQLKLLLGSFLLESPDGVRAENVLRAAATYRDVLDRTSSDNAPDAWIAALSGLANSLMADTASMPSSFTDAYD